MRARKILRVHGSKMGAYILSGGIETSPKVRQYGNCMYITLVLLLVYVSVMITFTHIIQTSVLLLVYVSVMIAFTRNTNNVLTILNKTWLSLCDSAFWCSKCRTNYVQEQNLLERSQPFKNLSFHW